MGQRLVITLERNERPIAAIYYHWGAYTSSALHYTREIINCIYDEEYENETDTEKLLRLIKFVESNGGGITGDEYERNYIQSLYPDETFKSENYSRNDGLISLSEQGISKLQGWSEGDVFIDLGNDEIDFCVFCGYNSIEEYAEERKSWDDDFDESEIGEIPKLNCELGYFKVEDIDGIINAIDETQAYVVNCNGTICGLIE